MHDVLFEAVEYLPAAHAVHVVAPVVLPVFVIEPAAHAMHVATFDAVEYLPAAHPVHAMAPANAPALVIDPAAHAVQYDLPDAD